MASALGTPTTIHWVVCADGAGAGVGAAGAGAGVGVGAAGADTANGRLTSTAPTWAARAVSSFDTVTQAPRMWIVTLPFDNPLIVSARSAGTGAAQPVAAEPAANRDLGVIQRATSTTRRGGLSKTWTRNGSCIRTPATQVSTASKSPADRNSVTDPVFALSAHGPG